MQTSPKHHTVRNRLEAAIRAGEYVPGEQLPAEQEIAQRFGVSYMTARRAVSELVADDVLERRARKGTFVRYQNRERLTKITLNLITSAYEGFAQRGFLSCGIHAVEQIGWTANVIRLTSGQQDPAVRVIRNGELAVVLLNEIRPASSLGLAMRAAKGKAVSLHRDLSSVSVPSILSDPRSDMMIAAKHLNERGHKKIAIVEQFPVDENSSPEIAAWQADLQEALTARGARLGIVRVNAPLFHSPIRPAYESVKAYLEADPETTALITTGEEIAVGSLAACRDLGRAVPAETALINMGDTPLMEFSVPPVTCINYDYSRQFDVAIEILNAALAGTEVENYLHITPVHLVERGSVLQAPATRQP